MQQAAISVQSLTNTTNVQDLGASKIAGHQRAQPSHDTVQYSLAQPSLDTVQHSLVIFHSDSCEVGCVTDTQPYLTVNTLYI